MRSKRAAVSVLFNEPKLLKYEHHKHPRRARRVSVLFNEPKLLKSHRQRQRNYSVIGFSALQRAEIAEIPASVSGGITTQNVSVLFNEPKLLKSASTSKM